MKIRQKAFGAITLIFVVVAVLLYVASSQLIQKQFEKIETLDTQKNTQRATDALNDRVNNLATVSSDWANWDDTYRFVVDHNQAFVNSNLKSGSISSLNLNFMLFYDVKQHLVVSKGVDDSGHDLSVPSQLLTYFSPGSSLLIKSEHENHTGFLSVNGQPLYFSSRPILTSEASGPIHGTTVFAKYLTAADIKQLAAVTHLPLQIFSTNAVSPRDVQLRKLDLMTHPIIVKRLNSNIINGYTTIKDVQGKPLLIARVELPRQAFHEAQNSVRYFLAVIACITLLSISLAIYITNQIFARDQMLRVKDEFFSIASHELRTPLTAIRGNATMLQDYYGSKNDSNFSKLTTDITESAARLIHIVSNFLDAARFEQGKVPLTPLSTSLYEVTQSVVSEMQGLARDKHIYIQSIIAKNSPHVYADPDRVKQVIYNFVGNAAKFTDSGGVTLSTVTKDNFVKVYITDTGRGITPESQSILFQKFHQVKSSDSKSGSGLGLYISKMMVELMGGKVELEASAPNSGTTISFSLPIATIDQMTMAQGSPAPDTAPKNQ